MDELSDSATPRKFHRDNPQPREESIDIPDLSSFRGPAEEWFKLQAKKNRMSTDEMYQLFYNCSMDSKILAKYLEGEHDLAWNEDEDTLIRGTQGEEAKRVLIKFKGENNVRQREEFLERVDRLSSTLHQTKPRYSNPSPGKKFRDFL